jgi:predicted DNA-binding protein with PD1-like motif
MIVIEVRNDELLASLARQAAELGITDAAIVSLIGAANSFALSTIAEHDPAKDILTDFAVPARMSGTGDIINGAIHIHATMAVEGYLGLSGRLHRAEISTWPARAYVLPASPSDATALRSTAPQAP